MLARIRTSFAVLLLLTVMPTKTHAQTVSLDSLRKDSSIEKALAWFDSHADWITEQQIRISEIPAPPFEEAARAQYVAKLFREIGLKQVRTDETGNVLAEWPGRADRVVLVSAHMDTVFPGSVAVRVIRDGPLLKGPGISDNGAGLAALIALARAIHDHQIRANSTIVFCANVGEEGEGNLRGMRHVFENKNFRRRVAYALVIDGSSTEHITSRALASRRFEIIVLGPGGHSWADFGLPNPIQALARAIAKFSSVRVPEEPHTTFNIGEIRGGTSVNSIPYEARMKVDIRSESEAEIDRLEAELRADVDAGLREEMAAHPGARGHSAKLEAEFKIIGSRPPGELPDNARMVEVVVAVDKLLGIEAHLERSSTDANIPLSLGIEAVALGGGGHGGASHSLREWYDPAGRGRGLKRLLLTVLTLAQGEENSNRTERD